MSIKILQSAEDLAIYDRWVKAHPQGNLWQSLEWKRYQEALGRETRVYSHESRETALVVIDRTSLGLSTWNIPRGPLTVTSHESRVTSLLKQIENGAKADRCISLFLSPPSPLSTLDSRLSTSSPRHEQPTATRILDLTLSDDELLAQMHQKGRYNINVAKKNGVVVERSTDIDAYYELAQKTGKRDAFGIPSKRQLRAFLENLEGSFLLLAYSSHEDEKLGVMSDSRLKTQDSKPIAGLLGVTWNGTGFYYYGASDYDHRSLMAPYLLQWEAMNLCKQAGCKRYDLLGVAPVDAGEDHPWKGISSFKEKFGGTVITYPPEQEITLRPMVKRLLEVKRKWVG